MAQPIDPAVLKKTINDTFGSASQCLVWIAQHVGAVDENGKLIAKENEALAAMFFVGSTVARYLEHAAEVTLSAETLETAELAIVPAVNMLIAQVEGEPEKATNGTTVSRPPPLFALRDRPARVTPSRLHRMPRRKR